MKWYNLAKLYKKSDALSTDYIDSLHDEELRNSAPSKTEVIVYHGTSMKKLVNIIRHGAMDPSKSKENPNYKDVTSGGIYVTSNPGFSSAEMYSNQSAKNDNSDMVVLELVVPLSWIEKDPDDTRYNENNEMNSLGKTQGFVRRTINIKRMRQIKIINPHLSKMAPNVHEDLFAREWTKWMTIKAFYNLVKKCINKRIKLPDDYLLLAGLNPTGLSNTPPSIDREQVLAENLITIWHTFFDIGSVSFEKVLSWTYKNKIYDAYSGIQKFLNDMRPGAFDEFINMCGERYVPRKNESLDYYLRRTK